MPLATGFFLAEWINVSVKMLANKLQNHLSWKFCLLAIFLVLISFTGGSARSDVASLPVLRPLAIIVCGLSLWTMRLETVYRHRFLVVMLTCAMVFVALSIVPVPEGLLGIFPGRAILAEIRQSTESGGVWQPVSMSPSQSVNSLYALSVPMAVLLLGIQLKREEQFLLLPLLIFIILLSALVGILQLSSGGNGSFYMYRITNESSSVGLLANRNHQAVLLAIAIPMLSVFVSSMSKNSSFRSSIAVGALLIGLALIPLLLVTGSRAGLLLGAIGVVAAAVMSRRPNKKNAGKGLGLSRRLQSLAIVTGVGVAVITTAFLSRAEAIDRLFNETGTTRSDIWQQAAEAIVQYFPFGSGFGSFVPIYQLLEDDNKLGSFYVNQAHNDFLDLLIVGGLPAILFVGVCISVFIFVLIEAFRKRNEQTRSTLFLQLGLIVIALIALGGVGDYPSRTPLIASILVIASIWASTSFVIENKTLDVSKQFV